MTLGEMLERSAEKYPDKIAIVFKERHTTYEELNAEANKLGRALNALGVGAGDKVGVLMPNCPEFIVGVFAALKAGAIFVPLNVALQGRELTYVINHSDAKAIICAPPFDEVLSMLRPQIPQAKFIITLNDDPDDPKLLSYHTLTAPHDGSNLKPVVNLEDTAAIYYTSGTTGLPKGAMLSHVNVLTNTVAIGKAVNASRNDFPLTCVPMFHALAMTACVMVPVFGGMTNVLMEVFLPQPVLQAFNDWKITVFVGVPTMFAVLANMPHLDRYDVSHLRLGFCGGAPLTTVIADKFEAKFPCKIYEGYGLSECSPLVSVNPLNNRKIGSIGKSMDRITWKIVDKKGMELPRNTTGEIIVSGPNIMKGYYKNDEATQETIKGESLTLTDQSFARLQKAFPPGILAKLEALRQAAYLSEEELIYALEKALGKENAAKCKPNILKVVTRGKWLYTGDIGIMDDEGFVVIADRKKDMIIVGGENVYSKEVEDVLVQHPGIQEAAVIGIDDPIRGEVPKAYIVPKLGATIDEKDVLAFCRKVLAQFKIPRSIEIIDMLPKNVMGKVLKRVLRRMSAGLPAEEEDEEDLNEEDDLDVEEDKIADAEEVVEEEASEPAAILTPSGGGMSFEEQIRMMEGGGAMPPSVAGLSIEEQMRLLPGEDEEEPSPPAPSARPPVAPKPPKDVDAGEISGFNDLLRNLVMEIPGGIAGTVAGLDGISIAAFTTDPDFSTTVADAELAGIMGAIRKAAVNLGAGNPKEAYFLADKYGVVLKLLQAQYFITLIVEANELNWGLTRVQLNKIAPMIEQALF